MKAFFRNTKLYCSTFACSDTFQFFSIVSFVVRILLWRGMLGYLCFPRPPLSARRLPVNVFSVSGPEVEKCKPQHCRHLQSALLRQSLQ